MQGANWWQGWCFFLGGGVGLEEAGPLPQLRGTGECHPYRGYKGFPSQDCVMVAKNFTRPTDFSDGVGVKYRI